MGLLFIIWTILGLIFWQSYLRKLIPPIIEDVVSRFLEGKVYEFLLRGTMIWSELLSCLLWILWMALGFWIAYFFL